MYRCILTQLAAALTFFCGAAAVFADPLPGEVLVFDQRPMVATNIFGPTYYGHDEPSTAVQLPLGAPFDGYAGRFMADDFAVTSANPIVHVRWWGSYAQNDTDGGVQKFFVAFERDIPAGPNVPFSRPGEAILSQIIRRGPLSPTSGTFSEKLIHPGGPPLNENLYEYNAELAFPFAPTPNTVYWLKLVALTEPGPNDAPKFNWGWHNRDYTIKDALAPTAPAVNPGEHGFFSPIPEVPPIWHFQDDAVTGQVQIRDLLIGPSGLSVTQTEMAATNYRANVDGPPYIAQFSKDLAFELHAIPEPSSLGLIVAAVVGWIVIHRAMAKTFN